MGKEVIGPRRKLETVPTSSTFTNKNLLQWVSTQQWSNPAIYPTPQDLSEDCSVNVVIKDKGNQSCVSCGGLKREGNNFATLFQLLREKQFLPRNKNSVKFFIRRGFKWEAADEVRGQFAEGSYILALVTLSVKKSIVKAK